MSQLVWVAEQCFSRLSGGKEAGRYRANKFAAFVLTQQTNFGRIWSMLKQISAQILQGECKSQREFVHSLMLACNQRWLMSPPSPPPPRLQKVISYCGIRLEGLPRWFLFFVWGGWVSAARQIKLPLCWTIGRRKHWQFPKPCQERLINCKHASIKNLYPQPTSVFFSPSGGSDKGHKLSWALWPWWGTAWSNNEQRSTVRKRHPRATNTDTFQAWGLETLQDS